MRHLSVRAPAALTAVLAVLVLSPMTIAWGAQPVDELALGLDWADDGECVDATKALTLSYTRKGDMLDAYANLRQKPSGGDCTQQSRSYTLELEYRYPLGTIVGVEWQGFGKFGADRQSFRAPYAIVGSDPRPDGSLEAMMLRAGSRESVSGIVGGGAEFGPVAVGFGYNVEETAWSDGTTGNTFHVDVGTELDLLGGVLEVAADADLDADHMYGSARGIWRRDIPGTALGFNLGIYHDWGRREVAPDAPDMLAFLGEEWALQGPGADTATRVGLEVSFDI
ncbi:MAG: hypothetical protein OXC11_03530 [Rhodospirillales bacterium]|nr:hypothetical protein [Rhodospirillales bacterium]